MTFFSLCSEMLYSTLTTEGRAKSAAECNNISNNKGIIMMEFQLAKQGNNKQTAFDIFCVEIEYIHITRTVRRNKQLIDYYNLLTLDGLPIAFLVL